MIMSNAHPKRDKIDLNIDFQLFMLPNATKLARNTIIARIMIVK